MGLRKLQFRKFKHNFRNTANPMCPPNYSVEDTEQILLHCYSYTLQLGNLAEIHAFLRRIWQTNPSIKVLTQLLLYGDKNVSNNVNTNILQLTLQFVNKIGP